MVNAIQMLLILPLIGAYMPLRIIDFIRSLSFCMLNIDFLTVPIKMSTNSLLESFDFAQPNDYLYLITIESGNSFVNLLTSFGIYVLTPLFHLLIVGIYIWMQRNLVSKGCCFNIAKKTTQILTFGAYIRFILEIYLFTVLGATTELHNFDNKTTLRSVSFGIAILIFIL